MNESIGGFTVNDREFPSGEGWPRVTLAIPENELEQLRLKAALLDRVEACIQSHTSEHFGVNIEISTGSGRYGMWIDDPDWEKFPLMNVLRDIWKLYHSSEKGNES